MENAKAAEFDGVMVLIECRNHGYYETPFSDFD